MLTKSELLKVFHEHDFRPVKRFGENYLIDHNVVRKIVSAVSPKEGEKIVEIGPGFGALTCDLAQSGAHVTAVEKDPKAFKIFSGMTGGISGLVLKNNDILDFDLRALAGGSKVKVVGNLPYYVTTPILEYLVENREGVSMAVVMVQREVAERLASGPGSKSYGSLTCFVQYHAAIEYIHTVSKGSFYPEPDVDSSVIKLTMRVNPPVDVRDEGLLFKIIRGAFNQRRKTIINSLSREPVLDMPKDMLTSKLRIAKVDPSARPETLSLEDFARITNAITL